MTCGAAGRRWSFRAAVVGALLGLAGCGTPTPPAVPAAADPFPTDGFLGVWHRSAEPLRFTGATLYDHIDGGAEVFLELGFSELLVQEYTSPDGTLSVELYRMKDPAAALGIYLMKCGEETPTEGLEARHTFNPYQLQMVRDSVWLTVNRLAGGDEVSAAFVPFAVHVAAALPAADTSEAFAGLPEADRVPGSERIVRGPFTLESVFTFGDGDVLQLGGEVTAVAAEYEPDGGERLTRLVVPYPSPSAATAALRHLEANLDPYLEVRSRTDDRLVFTDYRDRYGVVELTGDTLDIRVNLAGEPD